MYEFENGWPGIYIYHAKCVYGMEYEHRKGKYEYIRTSQYFYFTLSRIS